MDAKAALTRSLVAHALCLRADLDLDSIPWAKAHDTASVRCTGGAGHDRAWQVLFLHVVLEIRLIIRFIEMRILRLS